jgi:hypothetical protein
MCIVVERNAHMKQLNLSDNHVVGYANEALGRIKSF